jgi:glyoxylase-like metal-dependent hydrolase (beta-lactamase superfamily II)
LSPPAAGQKTLPYVTHHIEVHERILLLPRLSAMSVVERIEFADIEGLRVGRFTSQINTTCILYRLAGTVIDTGPANQWRFVRRFLEEKKVRRVLVTHHHEDHSGNLAPIKRTLDAPLLSPHLGVEPLSKGYEVQFYRRLIWGRPLRVEPEPVPERLELAGGLSLVALPTPGHSPDSTCYLEPERGWLFTGDLFIAARTRYLRQDENLGEHIESLKRVLAQEFETLLCSHRGVVGDGPEALARKLDYLASLRGEVHHLHSQGKSIAEMTRELLGGEDHLSLLTRFHFAKRNLIAACLSLPDPSTDGSPSNNLSRAPRPE